MQIADCGDAHDPVRHRAVGVQELSQALQSASSVGVAAELSRRRLNCRQPHSCVRRWGRRLGQDCRPAVCHDRRDFRPARVGNRTRRVDCARSRARRQSPSRSACWSPGACARKSTSCPLTTKSLLQDRRRGIAARGRSEPHQGRVPLDAFTRIANAAEFDPRLGPAARRRQARRRTEHAKPFRPSSAPAGRSRGSSRICSTSRASSAGDWKSRPVRRWCSRSSDLSCSRSSPRRRPRASSSRRISIRRSARSRSIPIGMQQIAWHLVSNAIKFTPDEGRVTVSLGLRDHHVCLAVTDTGVGFSAGDGAAALRTLPAGRQQQHASVRRAGAWARDRAASRRDARRNGVCAQRGPEPRRDLRGAAAAQTRIARPRAGCRSHRWSARRCCRVSPCSSSTTMRRRSEFARIEPRAVRRLGERPRLRPRKRGTAEAASRRTSC